MITRASAHGVAPLATLAQQVGGGARPTRALAAIATLALVVVWTQALSAQPRQADARDPSATGGTLAFEAATIKRAAPDAPPNQIMPSSPGRLRIPNMTLTWLIYTAYAPGRGTSARVTGGPDWINRDRWDVQGVAPGNPTPRELLLMLRTLLEERFALRVRLETVTIDVLALVPDRNDGTLGPNVKAWDGTCGGGGPLLEDDLFKPRCRSGWIPGRGLFLDGATMFAAAEALSLPIPRAQLGRLVHDGTGLEGRYNMVLDYRLPPPPLGPAGTAAQPEFAGPSLATAIREQWGLRLEPAKGPFLGIVVESVEHPIEN